MPVEICFSFHRKLIHHFRELRTCILPISMSSELSYAGKVDLVATGLQEISVEWDEGDKRLLAKYVATSQGN